MFVSSFNTSGRFDLTNALPMGRSTSPAMMPDQAGVLLRGSQDWYGCYDIMLLILRRNPYAYPETLPRRDEARRQRSNCRLRCPKGTPHRSASLPDLLMMVMPGGINRTEAEFKALLTGAGFKFSRVVATKIHGERSGSNQVGAERRLLCRTGVSASVESLGLPVRDGRQRPHYSREGCGAGRCPAKSQNEKRTEGHCTALVEMERGNLFTLSLGNVQSDDVIRYRFA